MSKAASAGPLLVTQAQVAQLHASAQIAPDTADILEAGSDNWRSARRFHKPRKEAISVRLDADVLDWLRGKHERYQTEINRILREKMVAEQTEGDGA